MKKLFASDFDNTIYFHRAEPPIRAELAAAIQSFQDAGHLFGLCTGRPVHSPESLYEGYFRPDFIIGSSGAVILDKEGNALKERTMAWSDLDKILKIGLERGYRCAVHTNGRFALLRNSDPIFSELRHIDSIEEIKGEAIHGVSFITGSEEQAVELVRDLHAQLPDRVACFQNRNAVDAAPAGCSKGEALRAAAEIFAAERTYGIGDSMNDLPLVERADMGFTFPDAPAGLRAAAERIVSDAAEALTLALAES